MKNILTILSILISSYCFSQVVVKVPQQDISGKMDKADSAHYVTPTALNDTIKTIKDTSSIIQLGSGTRVIYADGVSSNIYAKTLNAGSNVTITPNTDSSLTISASVGGSVGNADSLNHVAGSNYVLKTTTVNGYALSANVTLTKSDVGLSNVDNTSDISKPISTAVQNALNLKMNYIDTAAMLLAYLRKIDTTGKWLSPGTAGITYVHLTGAETITGTKTFNNSFQTNSSTVSFWGNGLAYGFLSWDGGTSRAIIGAVSGKNLSLVTGPSATEALGLDQTGNAVIRGTATASPAQDSAKLAQLGQIYPSTKKWVLFGDSFTADDSKYWGTVRDRLKLTGIVTNAVSGNTILQQSTKLDSILAANPTYFNSFDICSILIGINDFAGSNPLGTVSDTAGQPTYAGYLKHMIEAILTAKPTIELYILTPPEANGAGVLYKATNTAGWTVQQMSVLISRICYSYSVQCIDLYAYSQFNLKTIPTLTLDGLHPNAAGSKFLGNMVAAAIVNRQNFGKYISGWNESTGKDSTTTHSLQIKNNWKINNDGTAFFGSGGNYYGLIKWDTTLGGVQHRAIFGANTGTYTTSLFVNGSERATLDTVGNLKLYTSGKFVYGHNQTFTTADSLVAPTMKYVDSSIAYNIRASADLTSQTAAGNITTYTIGAADASFDISGYINVTAIATDVLQFQISYTDVSNTARTVTVGANVSATGDYSFDLREIRCKASTTITVKTNQQTGGGSETFYAGATILKIR